MFYVYISYDSDDILSSIGVTTNLGARFKILTNLNQKKKSQCKLVYYEIFEDSLEATKCENRLNKYSKLQIQNLVRSVNPMFVDLGPSTIKDKR